MKLLLLISTVLITTASLSPSVALSDDCMKTTATLSVRYNDSADTSAALFKGQKEHEAQIQALADKVEKGALTLTSMNYNVRMNNNNRTQQKYTINGNYNYAITSEALARKMLERLGDDGVQVSMRVNKNQDRSCMMKRKNPQ